MPWLALIFAVLAVVGFAAAFATGSGRALAFGMADCAVGLIAFCVWALSL